MDFTNWAFEILDWATRSLGFAMHDANVNGWGMTPLSLAAPVALVTLIMMAHRISRTTGPKTDSRDVGGALMITVIVGAAFLWIFVGLTTVLPRIVH